MSTGATARLSRLLAMVPWLLNRPGVPLEEAARHFGINEDQLVKDLELLFVCGTPGHMPDDLIDAEWDTGRVYLDNAETIARPLRLAPDEAIALIAGLRMLAGMPGLDDRHAVESALAKIGAAAEEAADPAARVTVDLTGGAAGPHERVLQGTLTTARAALSTRRRMHIGYLVPARDEETERDVDLMRVLNLDGRWYLEAWCHRAEDVRLFRADRITHAELLDADGTPPAQARERDLGDVLFVPSTRDVLVTLEVEPRGRWVSEHYPVESTQELGEGRLLVRMRVTDPRWVPRLMMRLGGAGRVVAPPAVVDAVVAAAGDALALYEGTTA